MLKRTKGRILLTTLVITGLAGTVKNTTLSNQERKFAVSQLKETKTDLLRSIRGLDNLRNSISEAILKNGVLKEHLDHISHCRKNALG